ncbi:hypothetical protein Taro_034721 [Colocasia esculenta]|uniref:Uncharacterized protein n=1 Tax=Colocasia esculenta TaxID=4460 RepID=A0A843VX49_COLES|nr:hypothetical protein [Colocasia esculenta]
MPTTTCHHLLLFALLIFVLHLGASMKPATRSDPNGEVHGLLPAFGLPKGLLPDNVVRYSVSDDGKFKVKLSEPCYAQFSELVSFDKTIEGKITCGAVSDLSGIKVKKFFVLWFPIVRVDAGNGDGTILFDTGTFSETHPASEFQDIRPCKSMDAAAADE